jgi:glucokinase
MMMIMGSPVDERTNSRDCGDSPRLLGDVGGTNARFAWQAGPGAPMQAVRSYACAEHASLQSAIEHYLGSMNLPRPRRAGIGIANPVTGDRVQMTNHHWSFSIQALQQALGLQKLKVINDFTALALALPVLSSQERRWLCGGEPERGAPLALIGPGTGLGVSGLLPCGSGYRALEGEGGHVTLCAVTPREQAVLNQLQQRFGHASAERAVSGQGLAWLYEALCTLDGATPPAGLDAPQISQAALEGSDARAVEALDLMLAFLGSVAGNLALTLGARGGIYLGGGVLPRVAARIKDSAFHERLIGKGRFRDYLARMPVYLIEARESPALRGVALALD